VSIRLTTDEYLRAAPDALGDIEVVDGLVVHNMATFEADTAAKRVLYAAAGIPGYLVVHFDKDWARISEVEEYRLDWSSRRYVVQAVHHRALILDDPFRLTVTFEDLQRP
jgi:hypothetical protein